MPEIEFEIWCENCGAGLCKDTRVNGQSIFVKPCSICLGKERGSGYDDGYDDGYSKAQEEFESEKRDGR